MKDWRISKVLEFASKGLSQTEIAKLLHVSEPTISRDFSLMRQQSHERIQKYIEQDLPLEYEKTLTGLNQILREAWLIISKSQTDERDRLSALTLARETYNVRLELLSSAGVVERAVHFVNKHLTVQSKEVVIDGPAQSIENT